MFPFHEVSFQSFIFQPCSFSVSPRSKPRFKIVENVKAPPASFQSLFKLSKWKGEKISIWRIAILKATDNRETGEVPHRSDMIEQGFSLERFTFQAF